MASKNMKKAVDRLVADPEVSVTQILFALKQFVLVSGHDGDIFELLNHPENKFFTYRGAYPHPLWMAKTADLFTVLFNLAPNTLLLSSRLHAALSELLKDNIIKNVTKKSDADLLDWCDLTIRTIARMFKDVKSKPDDFKCMFKKLGPSGNAKIQKCLDQIV